MRISDFQEKPKPLPSKEEKFDMIKKILQDANADEILINFIDGEKEKYRRSLDTMNARRKRFRERQADDLMPAVKEVVEKLDAPATAEGIYKILLPQYKGMHDISVQGVARRLYNLEKEGAIESVLTRIGGERRLIYATPKVLKDLSISFPEPTKKEK
jgi:hypothetical protein